MNRRAFMRTTAAWTGAALLGQAESVEMPIADTHVHFWDPKHLHYGWFKDSDLFDRPYLPADYSGAIAPLLVERIVFVEAACQADQWLDEVAWVTRLATEDARIQGIVAAAPLEEGEGIRTTLETLAENRLVRGVRRFHGDNEAIPDTFVQGVRALAEFGLSCDVCVDHAKLPAVVTLVKRCPEVRFMLDHIGVPDLRGGDIDAWRQDIRTLSDMPNVWCKMSGVATAADHERWTRDDVAPAIEHVLNCFGFDRTAFGSDWPVMLKATTFPRWVETLRVFVAGCSEAELRRLFHDTAVAFYALG
ncbi:MAG TPA: amidohydrolase [Candidatus Hydrogenedentes bacterium]|nr:amidohydrolase [Candidatus Hydrogenedentota bacterium]